jgi:hypothetical protein
MPTAIAGVAFGHLVLHSSDEGLSPLAAFWARELSERDSHGLAFVVEGVNRTPLADDALIASIPGLNGAG